MLKDKFKTAQDEKIIDKNDYWLIENNPLTKIGVFPYLGRQISPELEPDKIYQVLRPKEELTKPETLKSLELIPLVDEHTMLGDKQGHEPAEKKGIHGVTGTNVNIDGDLITNDLKIYSETLKDEIKSGKKDLSLGYYCKYDVTPGDYNGIHYDAVQKDIIANHIALVEEGRMGKDVRVMDSITFDTLSDILENKENYNMAENEKQTQDVDKRELIREVMAIAAKPNEDFEGGEEEKIETIAKKLETMSYNPSEAGGEDEEPEPEKKEEDEEPKKPCEDADEDKRKLIDEIGGILNGKVDEEIVRTVMGKAEKLAYNNSEAGGEDEDIEEEKKDKEAPVSMDEAVKYFAQRDELIAKLKPVIGDNCKYSSMTINEVVKYACDKLDIKNSIDTLEGYLKAKTQNSVKVSLDSAFKNSEKSSTLKQYLNK